MFPNFTFISNLLLAFTALAVPSLQVEGLLAPRDYEGFQTPPIRNLSWFDSSNNRFSTCWAGVLWNQANGAILFITGNFIVPYIQGGEGASVAFWVGIDGDSCTRAQLRVIVVGEIINGQLQFTVVAQWYPKPIQPVQPELTINAGDKVQLRVTAFNSTAGAVEVVNISRGSSVRMEVSSGSAPHLCLRDAEWIVEKPLPGTLPAADFYRVQYTSAFAYGPSGIYYYPGDAIPGPIDIKPPGSERLTLSWAQEDTVTILQLFY